MPLLYLPHSTAHSRHSPLCVKNLPHNIQQEKSSYQLLTFSDITIDHNQYLGNYHQPETELEL